MAHYRICNFGRALTMCTSYIKPKCGQNVRCGTLDRSRSIHQSALSPLQHLTEETAPSRDSKISHRMTKEDRAMWANGTHPSLHKPWAEMRERRSLILRDYEAPHMGQIRVISLNETASMNALSRNMVHELREEIHILRQDAASNFTRVLIIASESDKAFCAGANLKERAQMTQQETQDFLKTLRSTLSLLADLPIPTIAAVHGSALGGGLEMALCTTLRVFASDATVGLPEASLGIIPGAGGTFRLPNLIGLSRARWLMLTASRLSGLQALALDLCNAVSSPSESKSSREKVLQDSLTMAASICLSAPLSVNAVMQATKNGGGPEAEAEAYNKVVKTHDRNEALAAFSKKELPAFEGR